MGRWALVAALWLSRTAWAGVTVTLPATDEEVVFDDSAAAEVEGAMADLAARRFDDAARRFGALAEAGGNPHLRYLEAMARYEAGDLRQAERATRAGLDNDGDHAALLSLHGLVLADQGRGDDALASLAKAEAAAASDLVRAGAILNRGLVRLDRGEANEAEEAFRGARAMAEKIGATDLVARADDNLALVSALRGQGGGGDPLGQVSEKLRKGDLAGAKAAIPKAAPGDRRAKIRQLLAEGNVSRAEGRVEEAAKKLEEALELAREGGLTRETAAALAQLGVVYGVAGRYPIAVDRLQEAIGLVAGTSFRVNEIAYRVEAGRMAVRSDDLDQARAQLAAAKKTASSGVVDPIGKARLAELEGIVAARAGETQAASTAFDAAIAEFEKRSYWAEAARVATEAVELWAGRDDKQLAKAKSRAEGFFAKAGDPVGPAHVGVAEGIGRARRDDLEGALKAFAAASESAEKAGTSRGKQVAAIAKENAAQALLGLGHTEEAMAKAGEWGLREAVERQEKFGRAEADYAAAVDLYDAGRFDAAMVAFEGAWKAFEQLGEAGYAQKARRGRAWSEFNATIGQPPEKGLAVWHRLVEEAVAVRDPELRARAMAAGALDASALKRPEALTALRAAAEASEKLGLDGVAGQCWGELALNEPDLEARVHAARRAHELRGGDKIGTYAVYSAAVDAYNEGAFELAQELAELALPTAGDLTDAVTTVRDASRDALAER